MKKLLIILFIFILGILIVGYFLNPLSAPSKDTTVQTYIVPQSFGEAIVVEDLEKKGFIKSSFAFDFLLTFLGKHDKISSGGYYLSKDMDSFQIAKKITGGADMKWITFPEGQLLNDNYGSKLTYREAAVVVGSYYTPLIATPTAEIKK